MKPDAHSSSKENSLFTGFAGTKTGEASIMCISSACMGWDILVDSSIGIDSVAVVELELCISSREDRSGAAGNSVPPITELPPCGFNSTLNSAYASAINLFSRIFMPTNATPPIVDNKITKITTIPSVLPKKENKDSTNVLGGI